MSIVSDLFKKSIMWSEKSTEYFLQPDKKDSLKFMLDCGVNPSEAAVYTIDSIVDAKVVSPGFEPRSAGPEPTMMDRYTKRLADGPKASHSSSKRCLINHVIVQLHRQV